MKSWHGKRGRLGRMGHMGLLVLAGWAAGGIALAETPADQPAAVTPPNLIRNGDFERAVHFEETKYAEGWVFETEQIAESWEYHNQFGRAALVASDASGGSRALRIKGLEGRMAIINQKIQLTEPGRVAVSAQLRGRGAVQVVTFRYDKETSRYQGSPTLIPETAVNGTEWTTVKGTFDYDGKTLAYLAFYVVSTDGVELDDVTVHALPQE